MHGAWEHLVTSSWLTSLCVAAWGCPVTSSQLTSLCVGAWGHPVTSPQLTSLWMPWVVQVRASSGLSLRVGLGLHLFNKLEWWLSVPSRTVRDSRCCASQLQCNWLCMGRHVHSGCLPWCVGYCSWLRCCRCNTWCWLHYLGGRWV